MNCSRLLGALTTIVILASAASAKDAISIIGSADNRAEVFYARTGSAPGIYQSYQASADLASSFEPWIQVGAKVDDPANIVSWRESTGQVSVAWLNGKHIQLVQSDSGTLKFGSVMDVTWPHPTRPGRIADEPAFVRLIPLVNEDGRSEIFGLTHFGAVWSVSQNKAGAWSSLTPHFLASGFSATPGFAASTFKDGRLTLLVAFTKGGGGVNFRSQVGPNGGWGPWQLLGTGQYLDLSANMNSDGTLEVISIKADHKFYHNRLALDGTWNGWQPLFPGNSTVTGSKIDRLARNADGRLELFAESSPGIGAHFWQDSALSWNVANGRTGDLDESRDGLSVGSLPNGSLAVASSETSTCTAIAMEQISETSWKPLHQLPRPFCPPTVKVVTFFSNPPSIKQGQTSMLNWNYLASSSCYPIALTLKAGSSTLFSDSRTTFSFPVNPPSSTTYSFTAACQGQSSTQTTPVSVTSAPPMIPNVVLYTGPFENPDLPSQGQAFDLTLVFLNAGTSASSAYSVSLSIDGGSAMTQTLGALQPGASGPVVWSIPGQSDGTHEFTWTIPQTGATNGFEISTF